jgi:hypothetical protein
MGLSNYAHFLCVYEQADNARVSYMLLHRIALHVYTQRLRLSKHGYMESSGAGDAMQHGGRW